MEDFHLRGTTIDRMRLRLERQAGANREDLWHSQFPGSWLSISYPEAGPDSFPNMRAKRKRKRKAIGATGDARSVPSAPVFSWSPWRSAWEGTRRQRLQLRS